MKKTTFVSLLAICAGSLIILSNSSGPASSGNGNRTGAETGSSVGSLEAVAIHRVQQQQLL